MKTVFRKLASQAGALSLAALLCLTSSAHAHEELKLDRGAQLSGIDFELIPGAVIRGRLLAADTGDPVAGVSIGVYGPAHPRSSAWVQSDYSKSDGSYSLRVPAGHQLVYVASWPPPQGFAQPEPARHEISLNDGETKTLDFAFPRAPAAGR